MLLGSIFKKYKVRTNRILLIQELIEALEFDENQKQLYLDSIDVLDEEWLDIFYKKLSALINIYEEKSFSDSVVDNQKKFTQMRNEEAKQKNKDTSSLNLLLDNI